MRHLRQSVSDLKFSVSRSRTPFRDFRDEDRLGALDVGFSTFATSDGEPEAHRVPDEGRLDFIRLVDQVLLRVDWRLLYRKYI